MKKILPLLILLLAGFTASAQVLTFYRENITMKIREQKFLVTGTYYFRYNLTDGKLLYYPFPTGNQYGCPDSVYVFDLINNTPIEPRNRDCSGFLFPVDFSKSSEATVQISYMQPLKGNQAEYILETTRLWGKPFEKATYQLIIPKDLNISRFAIQPDDTITTAQEKIYWWERADYMPESNMIFEFVKE